MQKSPSVNAANVVDVADAAGLVALRSSPAILRALASPAWHRRVRVRRQRDQACVRVGCGAFKDVLVACRRRWRLQVERLVCSPLSTRQDLWPGRAPLAAPASGIRSSYVELVLV